MKRLLEKKARGLKKGLAEFYNKVADMRIDDANIAGFTDLVCEQMRALAYDKVAKDKAGNVMGLIRGYENRDAVVLIAHVDMPGRHRQQLENLAAGGMVAFKAGVISGVYAGALIKKALLPLQGDLIVCCVPRISSCDFGIKYLFDGLLKTRARCIKGIVLCEPTGFNINLGHKGRMEYEIVVKGKLVRNFLENRGINMLGTMFPLINELEKVSREMPSDSNLGRADLKIKDVRYNGYQPHDEISEFRVVVDRVFIPEEEESFILNKAKAIAKNVYKSDSDVTVNTALAKERIRTYTGLEVLSEKEYKPWIMEGHQSFAADSLKSLTESGFPAGFGYWKKIVTDGSYTYAGLGIPTIGFGAGSEDELGSDLLEAEKIQKAVYGHALIVTRNIGLPTFGWSPDEI